MEEISFSGLQKLVKESKGMKAAITFHSVADTDSVASANAMATYFENSTIVNPDYITKNAMTLLKKYAGQRIKMAEKIPEDADLIVLVDVNNFEDCGNLAEELASTGKKILIIDHHSPKKIENRNVTAFNDESYNSASSIVYELLESIGHKIEADTAKLLAAGIIADSAQFKNSTPRTFIEIGQLLALSNSDYASLSDEFHHVPYYARSAAIADLFKSEVVIKNNFIFIYGETTTHANVLADKAIDIGADVSLFVSKKDDEISFSARLRPPLDKQTGIHLGAIMKNLGTIIGGSGGGHPCAAGAYGPKQSGQSEFIEKFMLNVLDKIKNVSGE